MSPAVGLFSDRSHKGVKMWQQTRKVAHDAQSSVSLNVFTISWQRLWSFTVQTHGNMESIYFNDKKNISNDDVIYASIFQRSLIRTNQNARIIQLGPLTPKSDYHLISPYKNTAESLI